MFGWGQKKKVQECLRTHERMCRCEMAMKTFGLSADVKEALGLFTLERFSTTLDVFILKDFQRPGNPTTPECVQVI